MNKLTEEVLHARRLPPPSVAKAVRREAGVSQGRVASELGVHRVTVARWEMGTRAPRGIIRLAYADLLEELQREVLNR